MDNIYKKNNGIVKYGMFIVTVLAVMLLALGILKFSSYLIESNGGHNTSVDTLSAPTLDNVTFLHPNYLYLLLLLLIPLICSSHVFS